MKGLNLINSFVKGIINHEKKTTGPLHVILVILLCLFMLCIQQTKAATTWQKTTNLWGDYIWHALYVNKDQVTGYYNSGKSTKRDIEIPCAVTNAKVRYLSEDGKKDCKMKLRDQDDNPFHTGDPVPHGSYLDDYNVTVPSGTTKIFCEDMYVAAGNAKRKYYYLSVPVPEHFLLKKDNGDAYSNGSTINTTQFANTTVGTTQATTIKVYFYSFHIISSLSVTNDDPNFTCSLNNCPQQGQCGQKGCSNAKSNSQDVLQNPGNYYIEISFHPISDGTHTKTFLVSGGNGFKMYISVSGTAVLIPNQSVNYSNTAHNGWTISTAQTGSPIQLVLANNKDIWGTMDEMNGQLVLSSGTDAYTVDNANRTITLANSGSVNTEIRTQNLKVQFNGSNRIATNANCTINIPITVKILRFDKTHNNDVTDPVAFNIPTDFEYPIEVKTSYNSSCPTCYHYEMSANGTSGWQKAPLTINSGRTYYIRFAPLDSYKGGDKYETVTVTDNKGKTYNFRITGKPLETTTGVSTTITGIAKTTLDQDFVIDRNSTNFTISPSYMNTSTYLQKLKFSIAAGGEDVLQLVGDENSNTFRVIGYGDDGKATIIVTLPRYEDHYTESQITIPVTVSKVTPSINVGTSTITIAANAGTQDITVGNSSSLCDIKCSHYDASNNKLMNGTQITVTPDKAACATVQSQAADKVTLNILGAEANNADYTDVTLTVGYNGSDLLNSCTAAQDITLRINKVNPTIVWNPTTTEYTKGENPELSAPYVTGATYNTISYTPSHTNVVINNNNHAQFNEAGLYDIQGCLSENAIYKDGCSAKVPFKVNFTGFGTVELGSYSDPQSFTIATTSLTTSSLDINAPADFQIKTATGSWGNSININASSQPVTFYVRFAPTTVSEGEQQRILTVGSVNFTIKGTTKYDEKTFGETYIGQASAAQYKEFTGLCNVTAPNGFLVSANGTTWRESLSGVNITEKIYIKYQPNDAADGNLITINYGTNYGSTKIIKVTGTKATYTITPADTKIGLARDMKVTLDDNFTLLSNSKTITILPKDNNNPDYYLSVANLSADKASENPSDWNKTGVSATLSSKQFFLKFQPSDEAANRVCYIKIVDGTKEYTIQASGTGVMHEKVFGSLNVGFGDYHGFTNEKEGQPNTMNWYYFKNRGSSADAQFKQLEATFIVEGFAADPVVKPTVTIVNPGTQNLDFALNTSSFDCGYSVEMETYTDIVRVGFTPREAITNSSCDVQISANGKTYTYTVKGTATEQTATISKPVKIGQASEYQTFELNAMFRSSWGSEQKPAGYTAEETPNILYSQDRITWTKTLTIPYTTTVRTFYVKLVPEAESAQNTTYSFYIKDDGASDRGRYKFNVIGTAEKSSVPQLTATVDEESDVKSFTTAFPTDGTLTVRVKIGQGFKVSAPNGDYDTEITLPKGILTFNVKQTAQSAVGTYYATIEIKDDVTGRTYLIEASCVVDRKTGYIIVPSSNLIVLSKSDFTIVGKDLPVHGSVDEMNNDITLTIKDGDKYLGSTVASVINGKTIRISGNLPNNHKIKIEASFPENGTAKVKPTTEYPKFNIYYQTISDLDSRAWYKEGNTWYVYYNNSLALSEDWPLGGTQHNYAIKIYQPNKECTGASYSVGCSSANYSFNSNLFHNNLSDTLAEITNVTDNNYDSHKKEFSLEALAQGSDGTLITTTDVSPSGNTNVQGKTARIIVPLPQHYETKTYGEVNFGDVEVGEVAYYDIPLTDLFVSFLTTSGLKISAETGSSTDIFFANTANHAEAMELVPANSVISPYNSLSNNTGLAAGSNNQYYIRLYFKPQATGSISGSFTLSDDGNSSLSMTISVSGKGVVSDKEPQTIVWNQDLSHLTGSGSTTLTAYSIGGQSIVYSEVTDESNIVDIPVSTSTLNYSGNGTATIKAHCNAGSYNGISFRDADVTKTVIVSDAPTACSSETLDVSSWSASVNRSSYKVEPSQGAWTTKDVSNSPVTLSEPYKGLKLNFTLNLTNCSKAEVKIYLNGTSDDNVIKTINNNAGSYEIDLTGKTVNSLYCSFDGERASSSSWGSNNFGYSITNMTLTGYVWNPVQYGDDGIDFGTQRVGQKGIAKNIKAVNFKKLNGYVTATIESTNADYANCFSIVETDKNPSTITTNCEEGYAAFDVQFTPTVAGNPITANLVVYNAYGEKATIPLTGEGVKRDVQVKWDYTNRTTPIELNAVGTGYNVTLTDDQKGFLYDKLRGETAKLTINPTYTVENISAEMMPSKSDKKIIQVTLGPDGNIASIEATGYGSGTARVIASFDGTNNDYFASTTTEQNCTLNVTVNKVKPTITVDDFPTDKKYKDADYTVVAKATIDNNEIKDIDGNIIYTIGGSYGKLAVASSDTYVVSVNGDKLGMVGAGSPDITVTIVDADNGDAITTKADPVVKTFKVAKAIPTLNASSDDLPLTYPTDVEDGKSVTLNSTTDDGISWSNDDDYDHYLITIVKNENVYTIRPKEKEGSTIIKFKCDSTAHYEEGTIEVPVTVSWGTFEISLDAGKLPQFTSVTIEDLSKIEGFVSNNYGNTGVEYTYKLVDVSKKAEKAEASISGSTLTIKSVGKVKLQVEAKHGTSGLNDTKQTEEIDVGIGTLVFDPQTSDNMWETVGNWSPHRDLVPDATNFNAQIGKSCVVSSSAVCNNLTIVGDNAKLEVDTSSVLNVAGTLVNESAGKFVLKAGITHSATVLFKDGTPDATVEIYLRGTTHNDDIADNPDWQYRGVIGNYQEGLDSKVYVYEWNEVYASENKSCWENATGKKYTPWTGYSMANMNEAATTYTYKTKLIPTSTVQNYDLSYHKFNGGKNDRNNNGVNIVTNSYSAPIQVSRLTFTGMEQSVYFFRTDKHDNWTTAKDRSTVYVTCPSQTCSAALGNDLIPAGQAFLVQATFDGSADGSSSVLGVTSDAIVNQASGKFYAPQEQHRFNILGITVTDNSSSDELFLLESDECNHKYDNGYDGLKMLSTGIPQIYAKNKFGITSINADSSMLGQYIGFIGVSESTEYEIRFDIDRLEGYDELYLFDHRTKRQTDILRGSTYHFTATAGDDPERFQIMGRREDGTYFTGTDQWIEVVGGQALLHGFDEQDALVRIVDLMGNVVWTDNAKNGPWFDLPEVPAGVYIIQCGKATAKYISK